MSSALMFALGLVTALVWRAIRARGHALFGVTDEFVQEVVSDVVTKYTGLRSLHDLNTGPTHQRIFSGGTVVAWFEQVIIQKGLPKNVRAYVVWGANRRRKAADELVRALRQLGHQAQVIEPLTHFPKNTFLMVTSSAFLGESAHAFRAHGLRMFWLEAQAKRKS